MAGRRPGIARFLAMYLVTMTGIVLEGVFVLEPIYNISLHEEAMSFEDIDASTPMLKVDLPTINTFTCSKLIPANKKLNAPEDQQDAQLRLFESSTGSEQFTIAIPRQCLKVDKFYPVFAGPSSIGQQHNLFSSKSFASVCFQLYTSFKAILCLGHTAGS